MRQKPTMKQTLEELYSGETRRAVRFRYGILIADIVTIMFLVASMFFYRHPAVLVADVIFGFYILADYLARLWIAPHKSRFLLHPLNVADAIAAVSFLAPLVGLNFAFLRVVRFIRLLRSHSVLGQLRKDFPYFMRNEDIIRSVINLFTFIFVMTEIVFVTQVHHNPKVTNFLDAMYFTIATLTTTGFGDITLEGDSGRLVSIIIMIFGVSLFLRLIQTVFRPSKVRYTCPDCGLFLHENDAVHCKHCGKVLPILSDGHV